MTELNSLAILTLLKQTVLHVTCNRFTTDQGTYSFTANTATNSFTNTNITSVTGLVNWRKNDRFITAHNTCSLVLTGLPVELS